MRPCVHSSHLIDINRADGDQGYCNCGNSKSEEDRTLCWTQSHCYFEEDLDKIPHSVHSPNSLFVDETHSSNGCRCHSPTHDCAACQDPIQHAEIRVPCGHYYDKECIISLFEASTRDESLFHPRCCKEMIPFRSVRKHFSPTLRTIFIEKSREYGTVKRVYCAVPRCSLFLGPQTEGNAPLKVYKCKCGTTTCARCKNAHREGVEHSCKENADQETEAVLVLGKAEGWARCPGCRAMIELNMGCYHMTCLCKASAFLLGILAYLFSLHNLVPIGPVLLSLSSPLENLLMPTMG